MAFIAKLPDAAAIAAEGRPVGSIEPYGPHLTVGVASMGAIVLADRRNEPPVALAIVDGGNPVPFVELGRLDPITVPYVNRLLASTGTVVIKDWRTLEYRTKVRGNATKAARRAARAAKAAQGFASTLTVTPSPAVTSKPKPVQAAPQPVTVKVEPIAAAITMMTEDVEDPIPGMEYPTGRKVVVKGAGSKGWTSMDGFILKDEALGTLDRAWAARQRGDVGAVLITGPAGTAKTMMVRSFAAKVGARYLKVECATIRSVDDWSGGLKQDPNTKTWAHQWSAFAKALREAKPTVILLDELTRTESTAALNGILGLLDETGTLSVTDANTVLRLPPGIMIVATANIGPEFVGTLPLDGAVRQRFRGGVRMDYPTEALEAKLLCDRHGIARDVADRLVAIADQQRKHRDDAQRFPSGNIISTRTLLGMAAEIRDGASHRDAVWSVLRAQFDPADEPALTVLVDVQFPKVAAPGEAEPATIVAGRHYFDLGADTLCQYMNPGNAITGGRCSLDAYHPVHITRS